MRRRSGQRIKVRAALSVTAVAGVMVLGPWAALPAFADSSGQPGLQAVSRHQLPLHAVRNGVGEAVSPNFGLSKPTITVEPQAGTFPADAPPDLNGVTVDVTETSTGFTEPCTLTASAPGPATCSLTVPADDQFVLSVPADQVPAGFLAPTPLPFSVPDCSPNDPGLHFCPASAKLELPGTWRPVGVVVTNAANGKPVADARYELCEPAQSSTGDCPAGTSGVADATSGADGTVSFPGIFQGSPDYQVVATSVPPAYLSPSPQPLDVPAVQTPAEAGTAFTGKAMLTPKPPVAPNDTATLPQNTSTRIDVLANDSTPVGGVTLQGITRPAHGTATMGGNGTVSYTPAPGFVGTDRFDYTAVNEYGGTARGTVTLTVTDVAPTLAAVHLDTDENKSVSFAALREASAPRGNTLHVSAVGAARHGAAAIGRHGRVTYTPDRDYVGRDTFSYTVADNHGGTTTAQVTVTVARVAAPAHHSTPAAAAGPTVSVLPNTGAPFGPGTVGAGGLLVAVGGVLIGLSRRRPKRA